MNEKVSVVVPVYKVESYIKRCVYSLINQEYTNLEILLIDDGSPDKSGELCDELSKLDKRIVVYHKENGGLSDARNFGVKKATGSYITFVDSDDYVAKEYVSHLYEIMIKEKVDLVICSEEKVSASNKVKVRDKNYDSSYKIYDSESALIDYFYGKINTHACGNLQKIKTTLKYPFPVGKIFEDAYVMHDVIKESTRVAVSNAKYYYYCQTEGSIVRSEFSKKNMDLIEADCATKQVILKEYPKCKKALYSKEFIDAVNILKKIKRSNEFKEEVITLKGIIKKNAKTVVLDSNARKKVRCIALVAYINVDLMQAMNKLLTKLITKMHR